MCRSGNTVTGRVAGVFGQQGAWIACTAILVISNGANVGAQSPRTKPVPRTNAVSYTRDQQKQSIDDLTDGFMEDFKLRKSSSGRWQNDAVPPAQSATPEMKAVRPLIKDFSDEITQLSYALNDEVRRLPNIRTFLNDANIISALAVTLDRHASRINDHRQLQDEFQDLDAKWRELSYRLNAVRGISKPVTEEIAAVDQINEKMRDAIGMRPQVNRRELQQKTASLAAELNNLSEDIQSELTPRDAQQYQLALSRARQQVLNLSSLIDDPVVDMEMVENEYRKFQALWYPQRAKLQEHDNRYFDRSLRRITQSDGEIHQLLLLPTKVDSQQLIYLTSALQKNIDEFFERMSLKLLMHLPKADRVPVVASEFYGVCEHFIDEVKQNVDYNELLDSFQYIEQAQRSFFNVFGELESDEAIAALRQIEQTINTLSESLQVQRDVFDRRHAVDLAAKAETVIEDLEYFTKRWLKRDPQPFARDCLAAVSELRTNTAQLHQDLVASVPTTNTRREMDDLYNTWREVYGYLVKCQTEDRPSLGRQSSQLTPTFVELRTMLAQ